MTVSLVLPVRRKEEESSTSTAASNNTRINNMSLTYSDFVYPLGDSDNLSRSSSFSGNPLNTGLPPEFQVIQESAVPFLQNSEDSNQDFIVIAEFSELEGPIPLCTIPNNAPDKTDINLNSLAVHLMSTDYQVNTVGHFKICQDTQVMRKNVFTNVHVFMQYFTLYDIKARGFVRPFCFGYVSKDHVKIDKQMELLVAEFGRFTGILKHTNRQWFAGELTEYLQKLSNAKENFIQDLAPRNEESEEGVFYFESSEEQEDPDAVTLNQIAHQYSEIENILRTVQAADDPAFEKQIQEMCCCIDRNSDCIVAATLEKLRVPYSPKTASTFPKISVNIPLVHPLKQKGEGLRTLTTLGQIGTMILIWKLMLIQQRSQTDMIFSEMTSLTWDFRHHCKKRRQIQKMNLESSMVTVISNSTPVPPVFSRSTSLSPGGAADNLLSDRRAGSLTPTGNSSENLENETAVNIDFLNCDELCQILEKVYLGVPVTTDNKSGSYHTLSEDESDVNIPTNTTRKESGTETESFNYVYVSSTGSVESRVTDPQGRRSDAMAGCSTVTPPKLLVKTSTNTDVTPPSRHSLSSMSSEDDMSSESNPSSQESSEEIVIEKISWWVHASKKLVRGVPGYGVLNFFRRYHKVAHHILFSILIGRPIIICGDESQRLKVGRMLNSLIPLVPAYPEKYFKILRWHRGILVPTHFRCYKLIGLCIPERLEVHDLLNPRDQTFVTIFNFEKRTIMGPAYSGQFLQNFENLCQKHFYDSDISMLTYIGTILTEIESKVFMYKSLEEKDTCKLFKQLNLRSSDIEIVRFLGNMVGDSDHVTEIF